MTKAMENHSFGPLHPLCANHSTWCWGLMVNEKHSVPTPRAGSLGRLVSELGLHRGNFHGKCCPEEPLERQNKRDIDEFIVFFYRFLFLSYKTSVSIEDISPLYHYLTLQAQ